MSVADAPTCGGWPRSDGSTSSLSVGQLLPSFGELVGDEPAVRSTRRVVRTTRTPGDAHRRLMTLTTAHPQRLPSDASDPASRSFLATLRLRCQPARQAGIPVVAPRRRRGRVAGRRWMRDAFSHSRLDQIARSPVAVASSGGQARLPPARQRGDCCSIQSCRARILGRASVCREGTHRWVVSMPIVELRELVKEYGRGAREVEALKGFRWSSARRSLCRSPAPTAPARPPS
jgi:hypothetical protein